MALSNTAQATFKTSDGAKKYATDAAKRYADMEKIASGIHKDYATRGANASLVEATRNVTDHYVDKAKEEISDYIRRERSK